MSNSPAQHLAATRWRVSIRASSSAVFESCFVSEIEPPVMPRKARGPHRKRISTGATGDKGARGTISKLKALSSAVLQGSHTVASSLCSCAPGFAALEDAPEVAIRAESGRSHNLQAGGANKASATGRTHANSPEGDDGSAVELTASSRAGSMSEAMLKGYFNKDKEEEAWLSADAGIRGKLAFKGAVPPGLSTAIATGNPFAISSSNPATAGDNLCEVVAEHSTSKTSGSSGASLAEMLRSLPAPASSTHPVRAPGSYAASLGSVLWVSDSESELQPASRLISAMQGSHYSSIDCLADTRSSSINQGQLGYQRLIVAGDSASDTPMTPMTTSAVPFAARLQSHSPVKQEASSTATSNAAIFASPEVPGVRLETAVRNLSPESALPSTASHQLRDSPVEGFASSTYLQLSKQETPAHMETIYPAGTLSPQAANPKHPLINSTDVSPGAEGHQPGFAASGGSAPADLEFDCNGPVDSTFVGTAGLPAGGISWQLSELDVLLMKRQASLQKSNAARRLFLKRPFSSSPTDRTSDDTNMGSPRLLANGALEGWCYHTLASAQPMPRPQPAGVPTAATGAQRGLMAEHSSGVSTSTESATGPQVSAASQSSNTSGKEDLWCLRAHGGFTEKDNTAVVGQPTPAIKLLKIGSWGRNESGRWGRLKEQHTSTMAGNERSATDRNQKKASLLRNIRGPVLSKVVNVVGKMSLTDKVGHAVKETDVAGIDDSASGAGLLQSSQGERGVSVHAGRIARASSKLGSLFKRG